MPMKTVVEIVKEYLVANGYDGLCDEGAECGCLVDDLFPCTGSPSVCKPGFKAPCPRDCGDHDWHIVPGEPRFAVPIPSFPVESGDPREEGWPEGANIDPDDPDLELGRKD